MAANRPPRPALTPEAAAVILERKRAKDPVRWFFSLATDPHSLRQKAILEDAERDRALFRGILAGGRSGKSALTALDISATARNIHPYRAKPGRPLRLAVLCPSRKQGGDIWKIKLLQSSELGGPFVPQEAALSPMIPKDEIERVGWDSAAGMKVPTEIEMKNGNIIRFFWTKADGAWETFQGGRWDWIWADEGAMDEEMLDEAYQRLKDTQSDPLLPGYGGIQWSAVLTSAKYEGYRRFLEDCEDETKPYWKKYELFVEENPAISEEANDISVMAWGEEAAKIRLSGASAFDRLAVYPQLRREFHTVPTYEPSASANFWLVYDPGSGHQAGVALFAIEPDSRQTLRLYRYAEPHQQTLADEAALIAGWLDGRFLEGVVFDPAAKQTQKRLDRLVCQMDLMMEALTGHGYSVKSGTVKRTPIASSTDEVTVTNRVEAGIRQCRELFTNGHFCCPLDAESGGKLFWQRLEQYRFKDKTVERGVGKVVKKNDEGPDLLRYLNRWHSSGRIPYQDRGPNPRRGSIATDYVVDHATIRKMRSKRIAEDAARDARRSPKKRSRWF
jgi:hypothetical protein